MDTLNKRFMLIAIIAGFALAGFGSMPVLAQDDDDDEDADQADLDRIIVTGTRIDREGIDTFYPAITVDTQLLEDGAFTNVADALNQIPSFGAPVDPAGAQNTFSVGQNFVNFLGLGTQRTLTLVNGRRFVSGNVPIIFGVTGGLQVDFNVIPIALVDRVETIGVGGAPIYGSDAIAGTINVIMKDRYVGFDVTARSGVSDENDLKFNEMMMAAGTNFADGRGNVTISAQWFTQDPLLGTERPDIFDLSQFQTDTAQAGGTITIGDQEFQQAGIYFDRRIALFATGGIASPGALFIPQFGLGAFPDGNFYQFDENSNLVPFIAGRPRPGSAFFAIGGDGPSFFDEVTQINSALDRGVWTTGMNYDLTHSVRFSSDFLFSNSRATELTNQGGFQTFAFGDTSAALVMPSDHPFLHPDAQALLAANGLTEFRLQRFNNDIIDSSDNRRQTTWRATAGLDGEFFVGDRRFNWEAYWVHGESEARIEREGIIDGRFLNAIDVRVLSQADIDAAGEQTLATISGTSTIEPGALICEAVFQMAIGNPLFQPPSGSGVAMGEHPFINGCVPLNLFGEGVRSEQARDFVTGDQINVSDIEQTVFNVNFGGSIVDLPGGPLGFAVGYETRTEKAAFQSSVGSAIPLDRSAVFQPTGGEFETDEIYGEIRIPVLSPAMGIPFADSFELNAAAREIDNSIAGNDTTWTVGGIFSPLPDVTFRGNYTESVRAPSLVELFAPLNPVFSFASDPCDFRFVNAGDDPDTRRANCIADLGPGYDPDTFTSNVVNATALGRSGGNPDLFNESAEAHAIGLTFEPRWVDNLVVTMDLIDITLDDAILSLSLTQIMRACYDDPGFPNPSCNQFTRDADNQIIDFLSGQTNAQIFELRKLEIGTFYNWFMEGLGQFSFNTRLSETRHRAVVLEGTANPNTVGGFGDPAWAGTFDLVWTSPVSHRVFWRVNWQHRSMLSPARTHIFFTQEDDGVDPRTNRQQLASQSTRHRFIHNASYAYRMPAAFTGMPQETVLQLNINNVFDREPNNVERAAGHFGTPEIFGRNYVLSIRGRF